MSEFRGTALLLLVCLGLYAYLAIYEDHDLPDLEGPRRLIHLDPAALTELEITRPASPTASPLGPTSEPAGTETFTLRRARQQPAPKASGEPIKAGEGWEVVQGDVAYPADVTNTDLLLRRVAELDSRRVVSQTSDDLKPYGLVEPETVVRFQAPTAKDPAMRKGVIEIGDQSPVGSLRFLRLDQRGPVFASEGWKLDVLRKEPAHFRNRRLLNLDVAKLTRVTVALAGEPERKLERRFEDGRWFAKAPLAFPLSAGAVQALVEDLNALRARRFVGPATLEQYGLVEPTLTVQLADRDGLTTELRIGSRDPDKTNQVHAVVGSSQHAVTVDADLLKRLSAPLADLRHPSALHGRLDDIERFTVHSGAKAHEFAKLGGPWKATRAPEADLDAAVRKALDTLGLARSQAVFEADEDLAAFGLAEPELRLVRHGAGAFEARLGAGGTQQGSFVYVAKDPWIHRLDGADALDALAALVEAAEQAERVGGAGAAPGAPTSSTGSGAGDGSGAADSGADAGSGS